MNNQETEVKFFVNNLKRLEARLIELGAQQMSPRVHEKNIRFDLPDRSLSAAGRVLRMRRAGDVRLTYKGKAEVVDGVMTRDEFEFTADDFENAHNFIQALGYVKIAFYEKFRTTYTLQISEVSEGFGNLIHVMLDELPYGDFVELEGTDAATIGKAAACLGLDWEAAIPASYLMLFERVCAEHRLDPSQLTFAAFEDFKPSPERLRVRPADELHS